MLLLYEQSLLAAFILYKAIINAWPLVSFLAIHIFGVSIICPVCNYLSEMALVTNICSVMKPEHLEALSLSGHKTESI